MGKRSTITGYWRQGGNAGSVVTTPAAVPSVVRFSFDPTAASAATGVVLPAGSRVIGIDTDGGATGGAAPTIDIGTLAASDAFVAEGDADGAASLTIGAATAGASFGAVLTADTEVYAGVGASAAAGGTVVCLMTWIMDDDGKRND